MLANEFAAALIGRAFGTAGFVKFRSLSGELSHLVSRDRVLLRKDGADVLYRVDEWKAGKDGGGSVKFSGIDTPEAAKALSGAEVVVPRAEAAALGEGEYYIEDLKGLPLVSDGLAIGAVKDVVEGAADALLEIELSCGGTRYVPFRREFIGGVSPEAGWIELLAPWLVE